MTESFVRRTAVSMHRRKPAFSMLVACGMAAALSLGAQQPADRPESTAQEAGPPFVVQILGDIDNAKVAFVRRSLARAEAERARLIVIELGTFGGAVDAALRIATLIGSAEHAPTVAYIPAGGEGLGVSWSAGALIAFSCRRIAMAPGTSIGAAAPVYITAEGSTAASEKEVSALRAQMAALAEKNGYPPAVALAMVDKDVELVELSIDGKPLLVTSEELPGVEREAARAGRALEKGRTVSPAGKLLTLTAGEMERYGVSSGTYVGRDDLLGALAPGATAPVVLEETLPDRVVAVIVSPAITALLLIVGIIAMYLELSTPGFSVPGTVGLICFATVFAGAGLLGTLDSLEIIMFLAGLALLLVELFILPGFGAAGVAGILLLALSIVLSRQDFVFPRVAWDWDVFLGNLGMVMGSLLASLAGVAVLTRFLPRLPVLNRLVLSTARSSVAIALPESPPPAVGSRGLASTTLRPVGKAEIGGEVLVVEANGQFIEVGTRVRVIEVVGNRVVVEPDPADGGPA